MSWTRHHPEGIGAKRREAGVLPSQSAKVADVVMDTGRARAEHCSVRPSIGGRSTVRHPDTGDRPITGGASPVTSFMISFACPRVAAAAGQRICTSSARNLPH